MRRNSLFLLGIILSGSLAVEVGKTQTVSNIVFDVPATQHYVGPGDTVAFSAWYSCTRAYNRAAATGAQNACTIRRISDNATCTMQIGSDGNVDLTVGTPCNSGTQTVLAWLNNDSSCTAAISTTVMTAASCTKGHLAVGLPIFGAGVTAGTWISSLGTGTGGAGTYNLNISQTVASEIITAPAFARTTKAFDQTLGNACGGSSCDAVQATANNQPFFIATGCGGGGTLPCLHTTSANSPALISANSFTPAALQMSLAAVARRSGGTSGNNILLGQNGPITGTNRMASSNGVANQWTISASTAVTGVATDGVWHAANGVIKSGVGASTFNVDGVETTGTTSFITSGGTPTVQNPIISSGATGVMWGEAGFQDNAAWSSGTRTAVQANMKTYWATP